MNRPASPDYPHWSVKRLAVTSFRIFADRGPDHPQLGGVVTFLAPRHDVMSYTDKLVLESTAVLEHMTRQVADGAAKRAAHAACPCGACE